MPDVRQPPVFMEGREKELLRKLSYAVRDLQAGKSNNRKDVTLRPDKTTTEVEAEIITADTIVNLMPKTSSAALAVANVYFTAAAKKITIHHDSQPDTDRIFGAVIVG